MAARSRVISILVMGVRRRLSFRQCLAAMGAIQPEKSAKEPDRRVGQGKAPKGHLQTENRT